LVTYSDQLVDETTGRSSIVTKPASLGGIVGFIVGIPVDIVTLPITYLVYLSHKEEDEEGLDSLSTLLFPSFFLWRGGVIIVGTPFDFLEFIFYRAWIKKRATEPEKIEIRNELIFEVK
jgi:hypothetical protein